VEFNAADDAEQTMLTADKVQLKGHNIRVSYYIPGVRAINLYLKLLNENVNSIFECANVIFIEILMFCCSQIKAKALFCQILQRRRCSSSCRIWPNKIQFVSTVLVSLKIIYKKK